MTNEIEGIIAEINTETTQEVAEAVVENEEAQQENESDAAEAEESDDQGDGQQKPVEKTPEQKKIDRQRAALSDLQRKWQADRAELAALKEQLNKTKGVTEKQPVRDDYETTEEYIEASAEYIANQKILAKQQEFVHNSERTLEQQKQEQVDAAFKVAEAAYFKANPSYAQSKDEVLFLAQSVQPSEATMKAIYSQADKENNLPQVIDYFGRNGGENLGQLEQILKMSPVDAAIEIYKVQQKIKPQTQTQARKALPPPITPVSGASRSSKNINDLSGEDLMKKLNIKY